METALNKALFDAARMRAGLSITRLAQAADLNPGTVSRLREGKIKSPSLAMARKVAGALAVDVDELFPLRFAPRPTGTDAPHGISIAAAGRKGGKARAAKMTPAQRSAAARKAVNARWARVRGDIVVSMYVRSEWIRGGANDGTSYPGLHVRLEGDLPA